MRKYGALLAVLVMSAAVLSGCLSSGPEKPLKEMAAALNKKDPALFLAQMDVKRFAQAETNNLTQGNAALRTLDSVGKMLGLGSMDNFLGSVADMRAKLEQHYTRGVSTGELMLQCRQATTPDCPWVPDALDKAKIKELSPTAAVAQVTTPTNITSWLALSKVGDTWTVVGQAALEPLAAQYAAGKMDTGSPALTPPPAKAAPATPGTPAAPKPVEKPQEPVKL